MITFLKSNQIIVVGTNRRGEHLAGAAFQAYKDFGLEWGISEGLSGKTYAFPTLESEMTQVGERQLIKQIQRLFSTCRALPEKEFLLTKVGCGIAGFSDEYMKSLFQNSPENLINPEDW